MPPFSFGKRVVVLGAGASSGLHDLPLSHCGEKMHQHVYDSCYGEGCSVYTTAA